MSSDSSFLTPVLLCDEYVSFTSQVFQALRTHAFGALKLQKRSKLELKSQKVTTQSAMYGSDFQGSYNFQKETVRKVDYY